MRPLPVFRICLVAVAMAGLLAATTFGAEKKRASSSRFSEENRAVIVVTGLLLDETVEPAVKDITRGEGAVVRIVAKGGQPEEKVARAFAAKGDKAGGTFFTADFGIELGVNYNITMTFRDGTVIRVDDFELPAKWKTHFYFHSTRGTLSPASILRVGTDRASKLRCHVYAVFPVAAYRALGGTQVE